MRARAIGVLLAMSALGACGGDDGSMAGGDGGAGSDMGSGSGGNLTAKQFCVAETNRYRAMNGKPAVTEAANLEAYADTGAMTDYTANSPHSHFSATSGGGIAFAENECPGHSGWHLSPGGDLNALVGMCIAAFYAEGPGSDYSTHGHYINMMGAYATLGCGIFTAGNNDVTIIQDYGN
ncbi:MAG: CAP domain-containing protein [Kofleriaceae bacterium]